MKTREIFESHEGRKITKLDHYFEAYDRHFERFRGQPIKFLEIGAGNGGSAQMWKRYFGPEVTIVSIDINPYVTKFAEDRVHVRIGDQSDVKFLQSVIDEFGTFDIVLDDGSHQMEHLAATFKYVYPRIAKNGVYMAEDLCCAYWPRYGGGLGRPGSFIELSKALIDELNAQHVQEPNYERTEFTKTTVSMHFYDSIVVFERGSTDLMKKVAKGRGDRGLRADRSRRREQARERVRS